MLYHKEIRRYDNCGSLLNIYDTGFCFLWHHLLRRISFIFFACGSSYSLVLMFIFILT